MSDLFSPATPSSRRGFLKNAALAVAIPGAAGLLGSCAESTASKPPASDSTKHAIDRKSVV